MWISKVIMTIFGKCYYFVITSHTVLG